MRLLAIETSTAACSVALYCDGEIVEDHVIAAQDHTKRLLPMVDKLLTEQAVSLQQLDAIVYSAGPGSFTGLRIGLGIVQGLAFGADLPVIKVSSLETLASGVCREQQLTKGTIVIPAIDAHMGEVYWGKYRNVEGLMESIEEDSVAAIETVLERTLAPDVGKFETIIAVGDGWRDLDPLIKTTMPETVLNGLFADYYPRARDAVEIGAHRFKTGATQSVFDVEPVYVRNSSHWKKRERIRSKSRNPK